jgi:hypothetical protein
MIHSYAREVDTKGLLQALEQEKLVDLRGKSLIFFIHSI